MHSAQFERFYSDSRKILSNIEARPMGIYYRKIQHGRSGDLLFYRRPRTVDAAIIGHIDPAGRIGEVYLSGPRVLGPAIFLPEHLLDPEDTEPQVGNVHLAVTYDEGMALSAAKDEISPEDFPSVDSWITEFTLNFSLNPTNGFKEMRAIGLDPPEFTKSDLPLNVENLALIKSALDAMKRSLKIAE